MSIKDSLFGLSRIQQFMIFEFNEKQRLQELESAKESYRTQLKIIGLSTGLGILLLFALFLYRNNLQKRKSNQLLSHQKEDLENVLEKLKSTQAQLIHSEKMASLGELTAGIAHEIQNPLNFVNNFSEINLELIDEMEEELNKGNTPEVRLIAQNLRENNRRIDNHGKQAAGIVKGMLEHSRGSSVQKEPTHLKSFVDEYLRLSFHGYRVKDKSFHAVIQTDIDGDIGEVNVIRQEFGKVLLNLFNNAYYAMAKKTPIAGAGYEPTLLVTAKKTGHYIEILVKDNGIGIPKKILDKIFQPFFTTKPPGEGTGLGLSLCYDLIRAGGGEIGVESIEGEGTSFFIRIPA
jgi:signal transduction histidine kinase